MLPLLVGVLVVVCAAMLVVVFVSAVRIDAARKDRPRGR
jgi:uncharacterized integral membrane protein